MSFLKFSLNNSISFLTNQKQETMANIIYFITGANRGMLITPALSFSSFFQWKMSLTFGHQALVAGWPPPIYPETTQW